MKMRTLQASSLLTVAAILGTGCSGLTPGENAGVAGALGGAAVGGIACASGMSTGQAVATGAAAGALIGTGTYIIAKREATGRQRRVAEHRGRRTYRKVAAERK